ncbi:MAG: phage tail protein [Thermomicrobiales bacterium]
MGESKRDDPLVSAFFGVDFGKHLSGPFKSIDGLEGKVELVKLTQATKEGKSITVHTVGNSSVGGEVTLKRAMTSNMEMWDWRKLIEEGELTKARVNGTITLYDTAGKANAKWDLSNCWPSSVSGPDLTAKDNSPAMETVVIVHEGIKRSQ